jgi:hypothetical protein
MKRLIAVAVAAAVFGIGVSATFAAVDPPKVPPKGTEGPDIRAKVEPKGVEGPDIRHNTQFPPLGVEGPEDR